MMDILWKLRALPTNTMGLMGAGVIAEAIDEIERLHKEVARLKHEMSDKGRYTAGVEDAQADMRRALGLEI